jgi:hypothetical protein
MTSPGKCCPGERHVAKLLFREMAGWTRAIVRLEGGKRMVTEGYQKGVYEWVTKGIEAGNQRLEHLRLDIPEDS